MVVIQFYSRKARFHRDFLAISIELRVESDDLDFSLKVKGRILFSKRANASLPIG